MCVHCMHIGPDCGCGVECFKMVDKDEIKKIIEQFNRLADYNLRNMYTYMKGLIDSWEIKRVSVQGINGGADAINEEECACEYSVHRNEQRRVKVTSRNILSTRNKRLNFYIIFCTVEPG